LPGNGLPAVRPAADFRGFRLSNVFKARGIKAEYESRLCIPVHFQKIFRSYFIFKNPGFSSECVPIDGTFEPAPGAIAEGVETAEQARFLTANGCRLPAAGCRLPAAGWRKDIITARRSMPAAWRKRWKGKIAN